jgi:hypothetical protein
MGEGDRVAVEGAVTRAMLGFVPSVSREPQFARSAPTLSLAPPIFDGEERAVRVSACKSVCPAHVRDHLPNSLPLEFPAAAGRDTSMRPESHSNASRMLHDPDIARYIFPTLGRVTNVSPTRHSASWLGQWLLLARTIAATAAPQSSYRNSLHDFDAVARRPGAHACGARS